MVESAEFGVKKDQLPDDKLNSIIEKYCASLVVPKDKPKKQFFLCPVGLIGSGKTTVLKPLAEKLNLVRISGDEIRKILYDLGFDYDRTWEIGSMVVERYAREGYSIAHDTDCATPKTIEAINKLSKELGAQVVWVHVNPPEEFILNKLRKYKHTWLYRDGEHAISNYLSRKKVHENLPMNFLYSFDTSKPNLDEQIEQASEVILNKTQF